MLAQTVNLPACPAAVPACPLQHIFCRIVNAMNWDCFKPSFYKSELLTWALSVDPRIILWGPPTYCCCNIYCDNKSFQTSWGGWRDRKESSTTLSLSERKFERKNSVIFFYFPVLFLILQVNHGKRKHMSFLRKKSGLFSSVSFSSVWHAWLPFFVCILYNHSIFVLNTCIDYCLLSSCCIL